MQRLYLSEIASYGYLVIAPGYWRSGPGATASPLNPEPILPGKDLPKPPTDVKAVLQGIDWALAENGRKESHLLGRIDKEAIAVGGYSCGGVLAIQAASDPGSPPS